MNIELCTSMKLWYQQAVNLPILVEFFITYCDQNNYNIMKIKFCFFLIEILFFVLLHFFQAERDVRIAKELDLKLIYASKYVQCKIKYTDSNFDWLKNHETPSFLVHTDISIT